MSAESSGLSGPEHVESAAALAAALTTIRNRVGMSVRDVADATGIPASTLGGYFSGRHLPSLTQPKVFAAMLSALRVPEPDITLWREALIRARRNGRS
jgi:transcriptional regulator with XRE-family HTH domain